MFCHHSIRLCLAHFIAILLVGVSFPHRTNAFPSFPRSGTAPVFHSLEGQEGVLRMTLSGMNEFMVVKTGDPRNGTGELHTIKLHLTNMNTLPQESEYFNYEWTSRFMLNRTRNKRGNSAYVSIHRRDIIIARNRHPVPIWIYVRPGDHVRLEVLARELDCARHRVCGRGDSSLYVIDMRVPYFTGGLPSSCRAENRWTLRNVDGKWTFGLARPWDRGDLRIYPVAGTICYTGQRLNVLRPLQGIIRLPGVFNN